MVSGDLTLAPLVHRGSGPSGPGVALVLQLLVWARFTSLQLLVWASSLVKLHLSETLVRPSKHWFGGCIRFANS